MKVELTFPEVPATSLADVIRTGRVLTISRVSHLTYRVTLEALTMTEIPALTRALAKPHNHKRVLIVAELATLDDASSHA